MVVILPLKDNPVKIIICINFQYIILKINDNIPEKPI